MGLREGLRELARKLGYEVTAYTPLRSHRLRRAKLIREAGVDLLLDGGANRGQYAAEVRRLGYRGRIVSVEPLPAAFEALERRAAGDAEWSCVRSALAAAEGELELRAAAIAEVSSALRATGADHTEGWQEAETIRVPATTVDRLAGAARRPFLKLDLQGYELEALRGSAATLAVAAAVEVELSTVALYDGAPCLPEVVSWLDARGYTLFSAEPALVDYESGRVLQLDGLFVR
jgi:FkbM family methyltransferase